MYYSDAKDSAGLQTLLWKSLGLNQSSGLSGSALKAATYSLHCSSLFWFNQVYIQDPKK